MSHAFHAEARKTAEKSNRKRAALEVRSWLRSKAFWFSFFSVAVVVSLTGAFDTNQIVDLGARTLFCLTFAFFASVACAAIAGLWYLRFGQSAFERIDVATKVGFVWVPFAAIPGRAVIANLGGSDFTLALVGRSVLHGFGVAILVIAVLYFTKFRFDAPADKTQPAETKPADAPTYIEVEDHYLKIVSQDNVELIRGNLGRFSDELGNQGFRCHKSYWVSRSAIDGRRREGRQLLLVLKDSTEIPVGRSYEKSVIARLDLESKIAA